MGVTRECAPVMEMRYSADARLESQGPYPEWFQDRGQGAMVEVATILQGSGCLRCGGTGQL